MRVFAWCALLVGCGRFDFKPAATATNDSPAVSDLATPDQAHDAIMLDAALWCSPLVTETHADCVAAFANPTAAADQTVYDCAQACDFGQCVIRNQSMCMSCACTAYADAYPICDLMTDQCTAPLSGTGCIGFGFYAGAPFNCTSANGITFEGACMMRYLFSIGDC